jgi:hypothetical protein
MVDEGRGKLQGYGGMKRSKVIYYKYYYITNIYPNIFIIITFLLKIRSPRPLGILYLPLPFSIVTGKSSLPVHAERKLIL